MSQGSGITTWVPHKPLDVVYGWWTIPSLNCRLWIENAEPGRHESRSERWHLYFQRAPRAKKLVGRTTSLTDARERAQQLMAKNQFEEEVALEALSA